MELIYSSKGAVLPNLKHLYPILSWKIGRFINEYIFTSLQLQPSFRDEFCYFKPFWFEVWKMIRDVPYLVEANKIHLSECFTVEKILFPKSRKKNIINFSLCQCFSTGAVEKAELCILNWYKLKQFITS